MGETPDEQTKGEGAHRSATARAEAVIDRLGERVGAFAAIAGFQIRRLAARAGEAAEDLWAEAQSVRRARGPQGE